MAPSAPRRVEETDEQQDSSPSRSGWARKGAVNPAEVGTAGCKSRTASTASNEGDLCPPPREATTGAMVKRARGRPCRLKPALEASVRNNNHARAWRQREPDHFRRVVWCDGLDRRVLRLVPKRRGSGLPGVKLDTYRTKGLFRERGNRHRAPGDGEPGKLPSPARSRWRGGASGVVRARESRVHGERRQ